MVINTSFLNDLERKIRENNAPKLSTFVENIRPNSIPRQQLARFASLIRRMGGVKYALSLLNPIIRNPVARPPVFAELLEYASCLNRLSLTKESIEILQTIEKQRHPEVEFEMAAAYLSVWDCKKAIPHLERFIQFSEISSYRKAVGILNLGVSFLNTNCIKEANCNFEKVYKIAVLEKFELLAGNALELLSEVAIVERNFKKAKMHLEDAHKFLKNAPARYELYAERRYLIIKLLQEKGSEDSLKKFEQVRKNATLLREWNTIREIEIFKAIATNNLSKIISIYYGTDFEQLRERIQYLWGKPIPKLEVYKRKLGLGFVKKDYAFDVSLGRDLKTGAKLKSGQVLHRVLQAVSRDYYFPYSTSKLFSVVFQESKYDPVSSPRQVYGAIKRLNLWFKKHRIPLFVEASKEGYRLRSSSGYYLLQKCSQKMINKIDEFIISLKEAGVKNGFNLKMVLETLQIPRRTALRLLSEAIKSGHLKREGYTNLTCYFYTL